MAPFEHYCSFCGKPIPTLGGVKKHVVKRKACRLKWEAMIRQSSTSINVFDKAGPSDDEVADNTILHEATIIDDHLADAFVPPHHQCLESTSNSTHTTKRPCVTVEEIVDEEDHPRQGHYYEAYAGAGQVLHESMTCFEEVQMNQDTSGESTFTPFADEEEWGLAEWLVNNLGQTQTDEFLKLSITQKRTKPSFHNNCSFLKKVNALPHGTAWHCEQVAVTGNQPCKDGTMMTEEVEL
ncbi:hypothetical protein DFH29DRAFT_1006946 [Suillus ampliporus]|nr:hypothetical protein DFH29DRAFT_1006946 [Suillus ampliporus]